MIDYHDLKSQIKKELIRIQYNLPKDILYKIRELYNIEANDKYKNILFNILKNIEISEKKRIPMCQDTGLVIAFIQKGRDVQLKYSLKKLIYIAVKEVYNEEFLRKSIVKDPLKRENTKTNLPPVIYYEEAEGNSLSIHFLIKGFGSENASRLFMLNPTIDKEEIIEIIRSYVHETGFKVCPPLILGIGIGGTADYSLFLSKKALLQDISFNNSNPFYSSLEKEITNSVNKLYWGKHFKDSKLVLGTRVMNYPTHIAGMPMGLSISCWADRKGSIFIDT